MFAATTTVDRTHGNDGHSDEADLTADDGRASLGLNPPHDDSDSARNVTGGKNLTASWVMGESLVRSEAEGRPSDRNADEEKRGITTYKTYEVTRE